MVGTGVASFSHVGGVHYQNADGWDDYVSTLEAGRLPISRAYEPTPHQRLVRELILQLKLGRITPSYFAEKFGVDLRDEFSEVIASLESEKLATASDDQLTLTRAGLLQVDGILPRFFEPQHRRIRYT